MEMVMKLDNCDLINKDFAKEWPIFFYIEKGISIQVDSCFQHFPDRVIKLSFFQRQCGL